MHDYTSAGLTRMVSRRHSPETRRFTPLSGIVQVEAEWRSKEGVIMYEIPIPLYKYLLQATYSVPNYSI